MKYATGTAASASRRAFTYFIASLCQPKIIGPPTTTASKPAVDAASPTGRTSASHPAARSSSATVSATFAVDPYFVA